MVLVTSVVLRNGDFTFHGLSEKDCMNSANLLTRLKGKVQRSAKRLVQGLVNFVPALAYLFCLALPGSCLARFTYLLADLCTCSCAGCPIGNGEKLNSSQAEQSLATNSAVSYFPSISCRASRTRARHSSCGKTQAFSLIRLSCTSFQIIFVHFLFPVQNIALLCSIYTTVVLAVQRYLAISKPLEYYIDGATSAAGERASIILIKQ